MYLSAESLLAKLPELDFQTHNGEHPFRQDEQLQPASIDLKLSNVFWVPHSRRALDLKKATIMEISPRRYWKKRTLSEGEHIKLLPGQMLLGRVHEIFTVLSGCAGKIEGRSSYARLGLSVHCTGDFVNPGYRGSMPLQLVNHNPFPVVIYPYVPLCQLVLIKLDSTTGVKYGSDDVQSKYKNDDGGPSCWWRDRQIKRLRENMKAHDLDERMQSEVLIIIGQDVEPEIIEALADFAEKAPGRQQSDAEEFLRRFASSQMKRKRLTGFSQILGLTVSGGMIGESFALYHHQPYGWEAYIWWVATVAATCASIYWAIPDDRPYFDKRTCNKVLDGHHKHEI